MNIALLAISIFIVLFFIGIPVTLNPQWFESANEQTNKIKTMIGKLLPILLIIAIIGVYILLKSGMVQMFLEAITKNIPHAGNEKQIFEIVGGFYG